MFSFHDVCTVSTQYIQIVSPPPIPHKLLPTQISLQMIRGVPEQFGEFGEKATLKYRVYKNHNMWELQTVWLAKTFLISVDSLSFNAILA